MFLAPLICHSILVYFHLHPKSIQAKICRGYIVYTKYLCCHIGAIILEWRRILTTQRIA